MKMFKFSLTPYQAWHVQVRLLGDYPIKGFTKSGHNEVLGLYKKFGIIPGKKYVSICQEYLDAHCKIVNKEMEKK